MRHPSALSAATSETFDPPPLPWVASLENDGLMRRLKARSPARPLPGSTTRSVVLKTCLIPGGIKIKSLTGLSRQRSAVLGGYRICASRHHRPKSSASARRASGSRGDGASSLENSMLSIGALLILRKKDQMAKATPRNGSGPATDVTGRVPSWARPVHTRATSGSHVHRTGRYSPILTCTCLCRSPYPTDEVIGRVSAMLLPDQALFPSSSQFAATFLLG